MVEATQHHTERLIKIFANQFQIAIKKGQQDSLPFGCLFWLKAWISMGEKMLEWISRRSSPEYLLQAKMECVFQSVQYNVSPNRVRAKGCGREPLTTACLWEKMNAQTQFMWQFCLKTASLKSSLGTLDQNFVFIYFWETNILPLLCGMIWVNSTGILFSGCLLMLRSPRDANWNPYWDLMVLFILWTVHACRAFCHHMNTSWFYASLTATCWYTMSTNSSLSRFHTETNWSISYSSIYSSFSFELSKNTVK